VGLAVNTLRAFPAEKENRRGERGQEGQTFFLSRPRRDKRLLSPSARTERTHQSSTSLSREGELEEDETAVTMAALAHSVAVAAILLLLAADRPAW